MNDEEFQQFAALFLKLDPEGYKLYEVLSMIRRHGYGKLSVDIIGGLIHKIDQTLGFKLR